MSSLTASLSVCLPTCLSACKTVRTVSVATLPFLALFHFHSLHNLTPSYQTIVVTLAALITVALAPPPSSVNMHFSTYLILPRRLLLHHDNPPLPPLTPLFLRHPQLQHFKVLVFDVVKSDVCGAILNLIDKERDGAVVDRYVKQGRIIS